MEDTLSTDLFNSPNLFCFCCKGRLQYPVRTVKNVGNFCEACIEKSQYTESEENAEFQSAIKHTVMPCKYSYRGCSKVAKFSIIIQHERKCSHRDKVCPFYHTNKCTKDHIQNIMQHFLEYHASQVIVLESNAIDLPYQVVKDFNEFWLVMFKDSNVLLNVKVKDDKIFFRMYSVGNADDVGDLQCTVQHRNEYIGTHTQICKVHREEFIDISDDDSGVYFDIEILENYFGQDLNASIKLERDIINHDKILDRLECPICNNLMKRNIMLCSAGHSICGICHSKLDKCPICMFPFSGARNYTLESISDALSIKTIIKYECPLRKELQCLWKGAEQNILEHVKDAHGNKIVLNNSLTTKILTYTAEFAEINYLLAFGQVFKVTCRKDKYDDIMIVTIELIGHDEDAQKYNYNISLNSMYKQNIIWYTKSKIFTRRRVEYHTDYLAIGRIVCSNEFNISYGIMKNIHY